MIAGSTSWRQLEHQHKICIPVDRKGRNSSCDHLEQKLETVMFLSCFSFIEQLEDKTFHLHTDIIYPTYHSALVRKEKKHIWYLNVDILMWAFL
jgi:hypothetical protein